MSFKIVKNGEYREIEGSGHKLEKARNVHLHKAMDVNQGLMTMGVSEFQPGGGAAYGSNVFETIYYILEGELSFECELGTAEEAKVTLYPGDSFHCGPGTNKSFINNGSGVTKILAILTRP